MYLIGFKGVWTNRETQLAKENSTDINAAVLLDGIEDRVSLPNGCSISQEMNRKPRQNEGCNGLRLEGLMTKVEELVKYISDLTPEQVEKVISRLPQLILELAEQGLPVRQLK